MRIHIHILMILCVVPGCTMFREPGKALWSHHQTIGQTEINECIPAKLLHQDLDYIVTTIEDVHVAPYTMIGRDEFQAEVARVKQRIDTPLTRKAFFQQLTPLVHKLRDSHTTVWFPEELAADYVEDGGKFLPLDVEITQDRKLLVAACHGPEDIARGSEIHAINGVETGQLIGRMLELEKGATDLPRLRRLQPRFGRMLWEIYDFEGPFLLDLDQGAVSVQGMAQAELEQRRGAPQQDTTAPRVRYERIRPEVGLLTVESFKLRRDDFNGLLAEAFTRIGEDGIGNLIIDVRDNQGGSEENGDALIDYIWDEPYVMYSKFMRKKSEQWPRFFRQEFKWWIRWAVTFKTLGMVDKEAKEWFASYARTPVGEVDVIDLPLNEPRENPLRFNGTLYVLMNERSYSATVGFLGAVKDQKMGILVGTETGESPNGFGEAYQFDLPNSRLFCRSSTTLSVRPNGNTDMKQGVLPDHVVRQRAEDTEREIDAALEYALRLTEQDGG